MAIVFDDFLLRAFVAGVGIAVVAGPLGCHIIWQRMAYFGDTIAHAALFGVAIALVFHINLSAGVFVAAAGVALTLRALSGRKGLPADTLLGILAHGSLAVGLVVLSLIPGARADLVAILFGDILAVSILDLQIIAVTAVVILLVLAGIWRALLAGTVHQELAQAEGVPTDRARMVFMLMVAATVAIAVKVVGVMLITALLIVPAASARRFAQSPEQMALVAMGVGVVAVLGGLSASAWFDTPSGPSIVVTAVLLFMVGRLAPNLLQGENPHG